MCLGIKRIDSKTFLFFIPSFFNIFISFSLDESEVIPTPEKFLKSILIYY